MNPTTANAQAQRRPRPITDRLRTPRDPGQRITAHSAGPIYHNAGFRLRLWTWCAHWSALARNADLRRGPKRLGARLRGEL